ncbi:SprT family zinc-dependent metalloprotease [Sphingomonas sp.]|uniref:M48 family metallopeptidase n=1 Tax=Sphingomonas sp. TaxID=28214 RepID=UPI0025FDE2CE|nr:SprT family zinc-dependent metalloprotease [Sphingomonas sp.]MBV9527538.1 M48 family metallopeptidase [Sphingomonas sp.]
MSSIARSDLLVPAGDLPVPIEIQPLRTARRMRLRYDEARGLLKLTCPAAMSRRRALSWAIDQRDWIDEQLRRAEPLRPFVPGAAIPLCGEEVRLVWKADAPRTPFRTGDELRCGGTEAGFERRIEGWLRRSALELMAADVAHYALKAGVTPRSVRIGDAGSRWGSCSSERRIRLSWRLILAPPEVRRYVVAHEVAHLRHLDHGSEFKRLEASLFGPGLAEAKAELRRVGARLRLFGRRR